MKKLGSNDVNLKGSFSLLALVTYRMFRIFLFYGNIILDFEINPIYHLSHTHHFTDNKQKKESTSGKGHSQVMAELGLAAGIPLYCCGVLYSLYFIVTFKVLEMVL